jgi:hypothetical protein
VQDHYKIIANPKMSVRQLACPKTVLTPGRKCAHDGLPCQGRAIRLNTANDDLLFEIFAALQLLDISLNQWIRYL